MWKMKWKASWYAEFQTCVYSTIRGVNVLFFCFFSLKWRVFHVVWYVESGAIPEARDCRRLERWSFTELHLSEGKRVGFNSLKSIHFLPSGIFTEQTRQRENKVAFPHIFLVQMVWRWKIEMQSRRGKEPTVDYWAVAMSELERFLLHI